LTCWESEREWRYIKKKIIKKKQIHNEPRDRYLPHAWDR